MIVFRAQKEENSIFRNLQAHCEAANLSSHVPELSTVKDPDTNVADII
jgi:hypothetical protein